MISIKANCIDSTASAEAVFASEVKKMQQENMKPQEQLTLPRYEDTNTFFWIRIADSPVPSPQEFWGWTPKSSTRRAHLVTVRIPGAASPRLVDARRVCRLNQRDSPPSAQVESREAVQGSHRGRG